MTVRGKLSRETQPGTAWGSEEAKRAGMIKRLMRSDSEHENGTVGRIIAFNFHSLPVIKLNVPAIAMASWWTEGTFHPLF